MEYLKIEQDFPRLSNSAVTIGKFDGLHRGHRELVERITARKEAGEQAVLLAFASQNQTLLSENERIRLLERMGVDIFLECPLNERIRSMKAERFAKEILAGDLRASYVAVGEDFRFGYERRGTPDLLKKLGKNDGFAVEVVPKKMEGRRKISSTYLREELRKGNMEKYRALAGECFVVEETVCHGRGLGHKHFLPTTNLIPDRNKLMPPNGVYVTVSHFAGRSYGGITNIGYKPTVGEKFLGVETYLYDCEEDLYGEFCRVEFLHFSRPEKRFSSMEALRAQILKDARDGREYLAARRIKEGDGAKMP